VGGEGVSGEGVSGEGVSGEGVSGEGVSGEGVSGEGVSGEGVSGEGVSGEGGGGGGGGGGGYSEGSWCHREIHQVHSYYIFISYTNTPAGNEDYQNGEIISENAFEASPTHCSCKILLSAIQQQHSLVLLVPEIAWLVFNTI